MACLEHPPGVAGPGRPAYVLGSSHRFRLEATSGSGPQSFDREGLGAIRRPADMPEPDFLHFLSRVARLPCNRSRRIACLFTVPVVACASCVRDTRNILLARADPEVAPSGVSAATSALCRLVGPQNHRAGVYGTDLGFTVRDPEIPDRLVTLFGDTWGRTTNGCAYPPLRSDDLEAWLPIVRPEKLGSELPRSGEAPDCSTLELQPHDMKAKEWRRIRVFASTSARAEDTPLDTTALNTPLAAFSDGTTVFAFYNRNQVAGCKASSECPTDMACSTDASEGIRPLGVCARTLVDTLAPNPTWCRSVIDCRQGYECKPANRGVCIAPDPFTVATSEGPMTPSWYRDDPRRGTAYYVDVVARIWPGRPSDYAIVHRFVTNRFVNVTARTVANFDPDHPEKNDYRPGFHTLLVWGRAAFFGSHGAQNLPFLLYHPLEPFRRNARALKWEPRFFAGYDAAGKPRWSANEGEAVPIYGTDVKVVDGPRQRLGWSEPEFDYDNQMSVSWVAPLERWIMLYGGDVPAFGVRDPRTGEVRDPIHLQRSPGGIHFRMAPHPWGRTTAFDPPTSGWSSAEPVLTRPEVAPYMACGEGGQRAMPGCIENERSEPKPKASSISEGASCLAGELAMSVQMGLSGNPIGRLYSPNIIEEWTQGVTDAKTGKRAADIYWNVSTWNPYQVVLIKTRLVDARN